MATDPIPLRSLPDPSETDSPGADSLTASAWPPEAMVHAAEVVAMAEVAKTVAHMTRDVMVERLRQTTERKRIDAARIQEHGPAPRSDEA